MLGSVLMRVDIIEDGENGEVACLRDELVPRLHHLEETRRVHEPLS